MDYIQGLNEENETASERIGEALKEARDAETIEKKLLSLSTVSFYKWFSTKILITFCCVFGNKKNSFSKN